MNLLEIQHLKKYFPTAKGYLHAVDDVSLPLKKAPRWAWWASPAAAKVRWGA